MNSQQPLITCSSSSACGALWNSPIHVGMSTSVVIRCNCHVVWRRHCLTAGLQQASCTWLLLFAPLSQSCLSLGCRHCIVDAWGRNEHTTVTYSLHFYHSCVSCITKGLSSENYELHLPVGIRKSKQNKVFNFNFVPVLLKMKLI